MNTGKVIDLSEHFLKHHPAPRSVVLQEDLAVRILGEAIEKCTQLGLAPEVIVSATCALTLHIAIDNEWPVDQQFELLPPVLTKTYKLIKEDEPY